MKHAINVSKALKAYGVVSLLGGFLTLVAFGYNVYEFVVRDSIVIAVKDYTTVTIGFAFIAIVLIFALSVLFFTLGIILLKGKFKEAAKLCNVMIALSAIILVCQFAIWGLNVRLLPVFVSTILLVVVQSYSDPSLKDERKLQRKLRNMETKQAAEDGTLGRDTTGKGYIKLNFFNLFWIFVIASICGLIIEDITHIIFVDPGHYQDRAGLLYGPFSPIYGFGAVFMTVALNRFHDKNFVIIFLVSAIIGGVFEFFVSWFLETAFGIVAWDYTGTFLNIDGRTNFMFMCMWGALGLVWVKFITPFLLKVVNLIPWNWRYAITTLCAIVLLFDCLLTLSALDCWYKREAHTMDYQTASAITQFCNSHYDNEYMSNRFQSMTLNPDLTSRAN